MSNFGLIKSFEVGRCTSNPDFCSVKTHLESVPHLLLEAYMMDKEKENLALFLLVFTSKSIYLTGIRGYFFQIPIYTEDS